MTLTCSEVVVACDRESFYHQAMRIGLRTLYVHQAAGALELIGGDVAFSEHVDLAVGGDCMRIGEHIHLDGVGDEFLGDICGDEPLIESSFGEVHPIVIGASVAHHQGPVQVSLDGLGARGEVEHEFVEA